MARHSVLWYVFVGSRGGETRMCIVDALIRKSMNPRELSLKFDMDYSTIRHSLRVLEKNRIVFAPKKGKYAAKYRPTPEFESMKEEYEDLKKYKTCNKGTKV